MNREQIIRGINIFLGAAEYTASWTSTQSDDKAVAILKIVVQQEWFLSLLEFVSKNEDADEKTIIDFVIKAKAGE